MVRLDKEGTVTLEGLLVSSLAKADALAKLLIERASSPKLSLCRSCRQRGRGIRRCCER